MDLRSKLDLIKSQSTVKKEPVRVSCPDIRLWLDGSEQKNASGSYYLLEKKFPALHLHGGFALGDAAGGDYTPLTGLFGDGNREIRGENMLFLDTETTGLSGGTGTVAFLVGVGFFQEGDFILRQYFMRDYDEELALLQDLHQLLSSRCCLVTFNGKAFDWNLLTTRFTFNRIRPGLKEPLHLDLLYPSRALWKLKLESCRLTSLEENILGLGRHDDIPGAMIPAVYFKYLQDRDAGDIKKVMEHNEQDILSMVSLLQKINSLLGDPLAAAADAWELLGAGKLFEKMGESTQAADCYRKCTKAVNPHAKEIALKKLAFLYKRSQDYTKSAACLEALRAGTRTPAVPLLIELAKHYEHREKDYEKALSLVHEAMERCSAAGFIRNLYYNDLDVRRTRLHRKAAQK